MFNCAHLLSYYHAILLRCKRFYAASKSKGVGKCISMMKELDMLWDKKERFYVILEHCSVIGNVEACFMLGLVMVARTRLQLIYINNSNKKLYFSFMLA